MRSDNRMNVEYNQSNGVEDRVDLIVPSSPEMVRTIRLTVSGIASRMGFQMDEIEDIKVAVAEVCNRLITKSDTKQSRFMIKFQILGNQLNIAFRFENQETNNFQLFDEDDLLGIAIINSLIDDVQVNSPSDHPDIITLSMFLKES